MATFDFLPFLGVSSSWGYRLIPAFGGPLSWGYGIRT